MEIEDILLETLNSCIFPHRPCMWETSPEMRVD